MDSREFENKLLEEKIKIFKSEVKKSAKKLKIKEPVVKIWECPDTYRSDEIAHCHHESKKICISEYKLRNLSFEEIINTATHEVSHLLHNNHSQEFHETHQNLKTSTWSPPTGEGLTVISSNDPVYEEKKTKIEFDNSKCKECSKKDKSLKKCEFCDFYFCSVHIKPMEAKLKKFTSNSVNTYDKNAHPCLGYNFYLDKEEKIKKEKYDQALNRILSKNSGQNKIYRSPHKYLDKNEEDFSEEIDEKVNDNENLEEDTQDDMPKKHGRSTYTKNENKKISTNSSTKNKDVSLKNLIIILMILAIIITLFEFNLISEGFNLLKNKFNDSNLKLIYKESFMELNYLRSSNNFTDLSWNENSYIFSIFLAKEKEENNKEYLSSQDKTRIISAYNLSTNTNIFYGKVNKINKTEIIGMLYRISNYDLPKKTILNASYNSGALSCLGNSCTIIITKN